MAKKAVVIPGGCYRLRAGTRKRKGDKFMPWDPDRKRWLLSEWPEGTVITKKIIANSGIYIRRIKS